MRIAAICRYLLPALALTIGLTACGSKPDSRPLTIVATAQIGSVSIAITGKAQCEKSDSVTILQANGYDDGGNAMDRPYIILWLYKDSLSVKRIAAASESVAYQFDLQDGESSASNSANTYTASGRFAETTTHEEQDVEVTVTCPSEEH
jgi:hypothetical protein